MNLSKYHLEHPSEVEIYKNQMGKEKFFEYAISVYKHFARMSRYSVFNITKKVDNQNWEMFVKITCLYRIDFPGHLQVNNTFTEITRL
jgi:hypothetical protein